MNKAFCVGVLCSLFFCQPGWTADQTTPYEIKQMRNAPITMGKAKHARMHVMFDHRHHNGISCFVCHHKQVEGYALMSCSADGCHTDLDRKSRAAGSYFQAMHRKDSVRSCLGCHTQQAAQHPGLGTCGTCHDAGRVEACVETR